VVDTLGLPIAIQIQAGSVQERDGGPPVIAEAKVRDPRLALVWGDSGFTGRCVEIVQGESGIALEMVKRPNEGDSKRWAPEGIIPDHGAAAPVNDQVIHGRCLKPAVHLFAEQRGEVRGVVHADHLEMIQIWSFQ